MPRPLAYARSGARPGLRAEIRQRGMTMLEVIITLAVVGVLMLIGYNGVRFVSKSDLREDSTQVAAAMRAAHNMATTSGTHHRVVFDLDTQTYRIEMCEGDIRLRHAEREQLLEDAATDPAAIDALLRGGVGGAAPPELANAASPEEAARIAGAIAGTQIGAATCKPPELPTGDADGRGAARRMRTDRDIKIRSMFVQHLDGEQTTGVVHINFFPLGYAEKALIEIGNSDGDAYTLLLHRLTGRLEFREGKVKPEDHMLRQADGEDTPER